MIQAEPNSLAARPRHHMLTSDEILQGSGMSVGKRSLAVRLRDESLKGQASATAIALLLVAALTAALAALQRFVAVETVTIIYLIPVLVGAIRGGVIPAVLAAAVAIGASAFFFYEPIYDFRVHNPIHLVDLVLFIIVAVVTGQLATSVRRARMRAEADALREALIGSVSHELRTPLSSILGSASILGQSQEIAKDARLSALVRVLREEAERLDNDIQNLLDATRISSEGIRPRAEWVELADIVNAAVAHKRRLLGPDQVKIAVADDLPLVLLDSAMIEKALSQLIENAIKYSPPGAAIEISAETTGSGVRIAVKDQGTGLSADEQERIWDRFYRSPRHRERIAGSGLGLWIARALVIACGGTVQAFSAGAGRGATLSIHLPVRRHAGRPPLEDADE
jgi:K+-sensing histidine kinase KdpD